MTALIILWEGTELKLFEGNWGLRDFLAVVELKEYDLCHLRDTGIYAWGNLTLDPQNLFPKRVSYAFPSKSPS